MLLVLNDFSTEQAHGTKATVKALTSLFNYATTQPEAKI